MDGGQTELPSGDKCEQQENNTRLCDGECIDNNVPCKGLCLDEDGIWFCDGKCIELDQQCNGKCYGTNEWACNDKCIGIDYLKYKLSTKKLSINLISVLELKSYLLKLSI